MTSLFFSLRRIRTSPLHNVNEVPQQKQIYLDPSIGICASLTTSRVQLQSILSLELKVN